ncbi:MAG TPA: hypothetical protein VL200_16520 [Lacunisphaera sp.]|jgi:hypothetical protein|nr:hypothetical protein [Lacunisphaera sp.]
MPARDYKEFHAQLPSLVGRKCFVTLATNSLKLHIDHDKKGGTYLWVDPPWQFCRDGEIIESSASCPHHEEEDYEQRFHAWSSRFGITRGSVIQKIQASPDGSLWIHLSDDYAFFAPKEFIPDDPSSWFDHWYFHEGESNQPAQTTPGLRPSVSDL